MSNYAVVGNWTFAERAKGLSLYRHDAKTGSLEMVGSAFPESNVAYLALDRERGIAYVASECVNRPDRYGGGGLVEAYQFDAAHECFRRLSSVPSCAGNPCYLWFDAEKRHLIAAHHASGNFATKTIRRSDGTVSCMPVYDDAALVAFRLNEDGSIGQACGSCSPAPDSDGSLSPSHLHSAISAPDASKNCFIVCDKGKDRIYTCHFDADREVISITHTTAAWGTDTSGGERHYAPRYGVFHPSFPLFYGNNESASVISVYTVGADYALLPRETLPLFDDAEIAACHDEIMASDIVMNRAGTLLYCAFRGSNCIVSLAVAADGTLRVIEKVSSGGKNPRGLCFSPDETFLYAMNIDAGGIAAFSVAPDGALTIRANIPAPCPATMAFF